MTSTTVWKLALDAVVQANVSSSLQFYRIWGSLHFSNPSQQDSIMFGK